MTPSYLNFDREHYPWKKNIDYHQHPELYRVGKGEQGVLICEPYKSRLLPLWHFKTPPEAKKSSVALFKCFKEYLKQGDFVGADLARKFLQMGFTRARRYANYRGGRKYSTLDKKLLPKGTGEASKAVSAGIFYRKWQEAEKDPYYKEQKANWKKLYG
jgi:hypothetical protein